MKFREKLKKNKFVFTLEIEPPKGVEVESIIKKIKFLKKKIDAFNVTDMQASNLYMSSWAMCVRLKQEGLEPILQLTARDRNVLALQGDLLGSFMLGIENILLLTGDSVLYGDHPFAKEVFEVDSIKLIEIASLLNSGKDLAGNSLKGKTNFFIGAALNPFAQDLDKERKKMEKKIKAGVSFFQTQPVFNVEKFYNFLKKAKINLPVIAGIIFLKSPTMAKYLNENVSGIEIPSEYIKRLKRAKNFREEAKKIAQEIIKELRSISAGIHFMPFGWYKEVEEVLSNL
jgi:5,10-methylenetetrahydrofolate reductase